jgi:hypothetical protein
MSPASDVVTVPCYSQQNHGLYETFERGDFAPESGGQLRGASLASATFGRLANAVSLALVILEKPGHTLRGRENA